MTKTYEIKDTGVWSVDVSSRVKAVEKLLGIKGTLSKQDEVALLYVIHNNGGYLNLDLSHNDFGMIEKNIRCDLPPLSCGGGVGLVNGQIERFKEMHDQYLKLKQMVKEASHEQGLEEFLALHQG